MNIKFFKVSELDKNLKVTIHRSGKMGFTSDAASKLKLAINRSADIGVNADDPNDKNLYMILHEGDKEGQFRVVKAGEYFYINTKVLFDNLRIDYSGETVAYDITIQDQDEKAIYVLKRRIKNKKLKTDSDDEDAF